ncbi:phosphotransferase family protein [Pseudonocardia sp. ICBG1034]|uniref:phosphotransferase family protein n=1 Tax=Pseudonocardia sp. ICBG1034 TaxID=2844381 RepID=UPI001CCB087D|nr:phosphotransferase family protein [Pseudonocardia sp. ICBG1034]
MTPSTDPDPDLVRPDRLGPALAEATGDPRWSTFGFSLITGGRSNLTFLLRGPAGELVLRRPPAGDLLPTAHDMAREVRVQRALADGPVPVPRIVLAREDRSLLGVPFYVMERLDGHVIRAELPAGYADTPADRLRMADALVDALVQLHGQDPAAVGLGDLGRPDGFLLRQVRRWTAQSEVSGSGRVPALDALARALQDSVPESGRGALLHGDFRLDNCVLERSDPGRVQAVLDWEMSTLGDPLADLGLLLHYWPEPGEPEVPLVPLVTVGGGFPRRAHLLERYAAGSGADLSGIGWYLAFARFKFAVIIQGVQRRADAGEMGGQSVEDVSAGVVELAESGLATLRGRL